MTFLGEPAETDDVRALYDDDAESYGFVMNLTRVWAHRPAAIAGLSELMGAYGSEFSVRERGILITATASTIGDSYCSIAWGWKLGDAADPALAAGVLSGTDVDLTREERAMAAWARKVARDPGGTTEADVQALRDAGFGDARILAITTYVALRLAFSTVNGALGARPDAELTKLASPQVLETVTWGRPIGD